MGAAEESASTGATTIDAFLAALGARTPAPAGGAAAGLNAAFGAALLAMVARYTTGERYRDREQEMLDHVEELAELGRQALATVASDQAAFGAVAAAYDLPKDTDEDRAARSAAIQVALVGAVGPPLQLAALCGRLATLARLLAERGHRPIVSDVGTGAACVAAAADGTLVNLAANAASLRDDQEKARLATARRSLRDARDDLRALVDEIREHYEGR